MIDDQILTVDTQLPVAESRKLNEDVPDGIKQDVQEAEGAHFAQNYKSSAVMCRRALQLALEDKMKPRGKHRMTLGPLLDEAMERQPPLFRQQTYQLAISPNPPKDGHGDSP